MSPRNLQNTLPMLKSYSLAFSHDSKILAIGSRLEIKLCDVATGKLMRTLTGHIHAVKSVAFSHDSKLLVSGSEDKTARLWDTWTGETKHTLLSCHVYAVLSVTFSADWAFIVSGSMDNFVGIWDTATRGLLYKLGRSSIASKVTSVAVSRASTLIAAGIGGTKCTVNLWDVATSELQRTIKGHSSPVYAVAFSHNSKFLALGSYDDTAVIWDTATWEILHKLEGHPGGIYSVAFSHDDRLLAFSCGHNGCIRLCHVITGEQVGTIRHSKKVYSLAFSHDSNLLVSASSDDTVRIWTVSDVHRASLSYYRGTVWGAGSGDSSGGTKQAARLAG